jgi:hypothetical protein
MFGRMPVHPSFAARKAGVLQNQRKQRHSASKRKAWFKGCCPLLGINDGGVGDDSGSLTVKVSAEMDRG